MPTLMDALVDFVLNTAVGDPCVNRPHLRQAIANAFGRERNLVIEDESLDLSLLIGLSVTGGDMADPATYESKYLFASYGRQVRQFSSTREVYEDLELVSAGSVPRETLNAAQPGDVVVAHWQGEVFVAYQRLLQTNHWAKRNFPYQAAQVIGVEAFLAGWRAAGGDVPPKFGGPVDDTPFPILSPR